GWLLRHQLPFNFWIHMVGIPLAVAGVVLLFLAPWYWGVGAFFLGYLLQYVGHRAEGNDLGEWAGIKRLLGLPYVGVSPRWQVGQPNDRCPQFAAFFRPAPGAGPLLNAFRRSACASFR